MAGLFGQRMNVFLDSMGENLKILRKKHYPSDDQKTFAFRIGVGKGT